MFRHSGTHFSQNTHTHFSQHTHTSSNTHTLHPTHFSQHTLHPKHTHFSQHTHTSANTHTHTAYAQTLPWFPPLFCIWLPLLLVAKPARRHCVMTDSCCHIAMCLMRRTGYCSHLSSAHSSKNSGQLFPCEAVSFIVTLFKNGTSTGEVIDLW